MIGTGGRGKVAEVQAGDAAYIPMGFGQAIRNTSGQNSEIVQTWDNGRRNRPRQVAGAEPAPPARQQICGHLAVRYHKTQKGMRSRFTSTGRIKSNVSAFPAAAKARVPIHENQVKDAEPLER